MTRFEATICVTMIAATVTVLGFAIIRPPASRSEPEAAPSSATPVRPSSGGLLLAPTGAPEQSPSMVSVAMGQQVAPQPASGAPFPQPTRTTVPRRPASSRTTSPGTAGPAEAVRVTAASSSRSIHGLATWYCCTRGYPASGLYAAAGATLRLGNWRGRYVYVNGLRVRLVDSCACGSRVIDLYASAFRRLAPLSRGVVRVTVTW